MFGFDRSAAAREQRMLVLRCGILFLFEVFLHALEAALDLFQIGEHQLEIERLRIPQRIDAARRMRHRGIVENAQDVRERIDLTQGRQHGGIACAVAHDSTHINVLHRGVRHLAGLVERGELLDARLRHARHANVGGAASGFFLQVRSRQNAEKSCFADLR